MDKKENRWRLLKSKPVFESKWLSVYSNDYELPDGKIGKDYYHLARPDYVLVVAVDKNNRIIVQRNYRRGVDDFVFELPAGWIENGESPLTAAERELKEETGHVGRGMVLGEIYPQPAFSSMKAYAVLVTIQEDGKVERVLGHDEDIEYEYVDIRKLFEMVKSGKVKDMGFLSAIMLAKDKLERE